MINLVVDVNKGNPPSFALYLYSKYETYELTWNRHGMSGSNDLNYTRKRGGQRFTVTEEGDHTKVVVFVTSVPQDIPAWLNTYLVDYRQALQWWDGSFAGTLKVVIEYHYGDVDDNYANIAAS